jgi:hypothetical protein
MSKRKPGKQNKTAEAYFPRNLVSALLAQSSLSLSTFARARNNRVAMHGALCVFRTAHSPSRTGINHSLAVFGSLDFQTCRIVDSPKSAGREAALEVGLETCAAAVRPRDVTHN